MSSLDLDRAFAEFAATGSPDRLAEVYDVLAPELLRIAMHMTRSAAEAEDILQATFVTAIERAGSFEKGRPVRPWLTGILAHHARASRRSALRSPDPERTRTSAEPTPLDHAEQRELIETLDRVLLDLPEAFRPVLVLRLKHGLTAPEIAEALARPPGTVRSQLARGLEAVRRALPAGLAGAFVLLAAQPVRGLDSIREAVLSQAAQHAPLATSVTTMTGVLVMKKIAALVVVLALAWLGWNVVNRSTEIASLVATDPAQHDTLEESTREPSSKGDLSLAAATARSRAPLPVATSRATAPARVDVQAVSARDQRPIVGEVVLVRFDGAALPYPDERAVTTDANGRAVLDDVPLGNVNARTMQGGDVWGKAQSGQTLTLLVERPAGIRVEGEVVDVDGIGVSGASVWSSERAMPWIGRVINTCNAAGRFVLEDVGPDHYLGAKARGHALSYLQPVRGSPGEVVQMRIVLDRDGAQLRGRVLDARGQIVSGARVLAGDEEARLDRTLDDGLSVPSGAPQTATADGNGRFELDGLPLGPILLQARAPGFGTTRVQARLDASGTEQDIVLQDEAVVVGSMSAPDGTHPAYVEIRCGEYARFATSLAFSRAKGAFELRGLSAGENHLIAQRADGLRAETTVMLAAGGRAVWNPSLTAADVSGARLLHGVLLDEQRVALAGWTVVAEKEDEPSRSPISSSPSDASGRFSLRLDGDALFELRVFGPEEWKQFPRAIQRGVRIGDDDVVIVIPDEARTTANFSGAVVDPSGSPATDAQVIVWHVDLRQRLEIQVDHATGRFEIAHVPPGKVQLDVRSVSWPWLNVGERTVEAGERVDLGMIRLPSAGRIVGTLAGARDESASDVELSIVDARNLLVGQVERHDREWKSSPLAPGHYTVFARGPHVADVRADVEIAAGRDARIELVLRDAYARAVRVESTPTTDATAWVTLDVVGADMKSISMRSVHFGPGGIAHADVPVPPGEWKLMAMSSTGQRAESTFVQVAGSSGTELVLHLPAAH